ncbi:4-hydroxyphenylacetate 3-monooxygenase [Sporosarcina ureae]|uniref:4-hydroxyphenylacetate 3-monooxygenase, oxygenase component n=1 Tax=Sporosarcina TaxID=1569 RepID=UPI000A16555E|nr:MULTISPECIES: 4-hydroxyphenylacetate 3-monooxygenase, oxygenase component [Sporosarcina]ARJ38762.1 4-hydroxyphenylacetate 3-monooxygenase [Sporosarcina ureae]PIC84227.1 4-hydroxyphenylacetate 3-monooxygenase, oxygenase component [Sporosarcina sp. P1]
MGAINGNEFVRRMDEQNAEIWLDGKQLKGPISKHPAFKGLIETKASLYDLQLSPSHKALMTYASPVTNERIGLSYLQPKTKADLRNRRVMTEEWARLSCGLLGRSPDYLNTVIMSFASSSAHLLGKENCFPEHIQALYERAREEDLSFTHTFITPQVNRSQAAFTTSDEPISAKIVDKTAAGLIIKGAKLLATQGGVTDEVLVFSTPSFLGDSDEAFAFSIPSRTEGLRFLCRESFVGGNSTFNYPLSSRFEEMDAVVVFDNVLVPWERVFFHHNKEVASEFFSMSSFHPFATHQVITRQIVKTEFMLNLAEQLVQMINVAEYLHIQEKLSEIIIGLETMKALRDKSEADASLDQWGNMCPSAIPLQVASNIFPKVYPRFSEIIQLIGASGMIALPTDKDFQSPIQLDLEKYLQGATKTALERVQLFRLAWDLTMSSFGTRQTQYERYFFGDPVRLSGHLYRSYPKDAGQEMIRRLLSY